MKFISLLTPRLISQVGTNQQYRFPCYYITYISRTSYLNIICFCNPPNMLCLIFFFVYGLIVNVLLTLYEIERRSRKQLENKPKRPSADCTSESNNDTGSTWKMNSLKHVCLSLLVVDYFVIYILYLFITHICTSYKK